MCRLFQLQKNEIWRQHGFLTLSLHTLPRIHGISTGKALLRWDLIFPHSLPAELLVAGLKESNFWVVGGEFVNIQFICLSWHWALRALSITVQTDIFRLELISFRYQNLRIFLPSPPYFFPPCGCLILKVCISWWGSQQGCSSSEGMLIISSAGSQTPPRSSILDGLKLLRFALAGWKAQPHTQSWFLEKEAKGIQLFPRREGWKDSPAGPERWFYSVLGLETNLNVSLVQPSFSECLGVGIVHFQL